jgi:hypothetical protein
MSPNANNWREQLAFLDVPKQDFGDTITDKELTIRLLLAILWQSNRAGCPDNREEWQKGTDHDSQGNLFGDICNALRRLGVDDPCEGTGHGYYDFSGGAS